MKFCDCQPLSLFDPECLLETLRNRDSEVLFAILSVSLRFSEDDVLRDNIVDLNDGYAEAARRIVMHRVTNGPVELSTLQTLCLLSSIDFTSKLTDIRMRSCFTKLWTRWPQAPC